jgi:hypothetical protein
MCRDFVSPLDGDSRTYSRQVFLAHAVDQATNWSSHTKTFNQENKPLGSKKTKVNWNAALLQVKK